MTPFKMLIDRNPRATLDILVLQVDDTEWTGGLDSFKENMRHTLREVRGALRVAHDKREAARCRQKAATHLSSAGVQSNRGTGSLSRSSPALSAVKASRLEIKPEYMKSRLGHGVYQRSYYSGSVS